MRLIVVVILSLVFCACGGRTVPRPSGKDASATDSWRPPPPQERWYPRDRWVPLDAYVPPPPQDYYVPPPPKDMFLPPKDNTMPKCIQMGHTCMASSSCCQGLTCESLSTGVQICTRTCHPDSPQTPLVNEDNCTSGYICGTISPPGQIYRCLQKCTPTMSHNPCPVGLACKPKSTQYSRTVNKAVCVYPPCTSGKDCPVALSETCNQATAVPKCTKSPKGAFCAPDPLSTLGGRCNLAGACHAKSGLCNPHKYGKPAAKVGDPCKDDRDCNGTMFCLQQQATLGAPQYRNGYCTVSGCTFAKSLSIRACGTGSSCFSYTYGGICFKTCDLKNASSCRGQAKDKHGDYECRAWNNLTMGGVLISKTPICEPGHRVPCDLFSGAKLDCSVLGLSGNPTKMSCRDPKSGKVLTKFDSSGYCLDATASGSK